MVWQVRGEAKAMSDKKTLLIPFLLIAVGVGWLLSALGIAPSIDWVWTLGLATIGILAFLLSGIDKFTVVVGPLFLFASLLSVLRQTGKLDFNVEIPILVIWTGLLFLLARLKSIPVPDWLNDTK